MARSPWSLMRNTDLRNRGLNPYQIQALQDQEELDQQVMDEQVAQLQARLGDPRAALPAKAGKGESHSADTRSEVERKKMVKLDQFKSPSQYDMHLKMAQGIIPGDVDIFGRQLSEDEVNSDHPYQIQKAGLDRLDQVVQDMIAMESQREGQMDLTPLNSLASYLTDGKFKGALTKPTDQERYLKVLGYADDLQKRRADLSKTALEGMKGLKAGSSMDATEMALLKALGVEVEDPDMAARKGLFGGDPSTRAKRWIDTIKHLPTYKPHQESLSASAAIVNDPNIEHWVVDTMLKTQLLQAARLYPISNLDVQLFSTGPGFLHKAESAWNRLANNQPLLPGDKEAIKAYATGIRGAAAKAALNAVNTFNQSVAPEFGYDAATAQRLSAPLLVEAQQALAAAEAANAKSAKTPKTKKSKGSNAKQSAGKPAPDFDKMTTEELEKWVKENGG